MDSVYALVALFFATGIYFTGYLVGRATGERRREEHVERERGREAKFLLEHTGIAWRKR